MLCSILDRVNDEGRQMLDFKEMVKRWLRWDALSVGGLRGWARLLLKRYSHWNWSWRIDMALRYAPVVRAIVATGIAHPLICDVGSGSKGGITPYLRGEAVGVDLCFDVEAVKARPLMHPICGSATELPLADETFDIVVCMDTLEHLAEEQRSVVLEELFRIVRDGGWVMVGAPCGEEIRRCEERVNALYRRKTGGDHHMLLEHLQNKPLFPEELENCIKSTASGRFGQYKLRAVSNVNLGLWYRLRILLYLERPIPFLSQFQRFVFQPIFPLLACRNEEPCYRRIFFVHGQR